ncbi:hypothetical protein [Streptosporangium sp. NPDC000239]|uniref:Secreted protein n=1 Tax=Streptosporangium jomthongense TaxID=1193683 RepID=A0ABV8F168_9ACTN
MTNFLFFLAAAVFLAVVVPRFGADTRDGRDWKPADPYPPERAVVTAVTGRQTGRARAGRRTPRRRATEVRASGPRGTVGVRHP